MSDYIYAILSALLWAVSAPIVNLGIKNLPLENRYSAIFFVLFCALLAGVMLLFPFTSDSVFNIYNINIYIILSGIFTFPIATGMYYLSASAFGTRAELASQFAKVKPLFSILFAAIFLNEVIDTSSTIAIVLICLGLLMFVKAAPASHFTWHALLWGVLTAITWAVGEVLVKIGFQEGNTIDNSFIALTSSFVLVTIIVIPSIKKYFTRNSLCWVMPFAMHGILSFSIAYTCFFKSIITIGLAKTVIVNAFWPALSVLIVYAHKRFNGEIYRVNHYLIVAMVLFVCASIIAITSTKIH